MELGDFAVLLGMLIVFLYGLVSEPPTGYMNLQAKFIEANEPEAAQIYDERSWESEEVQDHDDDMDFSLPCPPGQEVQAAMDVFYLPLAPMFESIKKPAAAGVSSQTNLPGDDAHLVALPSLPAALLTARPPSIERPTPRLFSASAESGGQHSPSRPASPRPVSPRVIALHACERGLTASSGGATPCGGSPRSRLATPLHVDVCSSLSGGHQAVAGQRSRVASGRSSMDGGSGMSSSGASSEPEFIGEEAMAAPSANASSVMGVRKGTPPSPVSVLFRAAEFERLSRGVKACTPPSPSPAATPRASVVTPRSDTDRVAISEGGCLGAAAEAGGSSVTSSPTAAAATSNPGYGGRNVSSSSSGGLLRTPVRPPLNPNGGGVFGSGGGSNVASPSYLALARASQMRALACGSPSSPATPSPVSKKRLAKPNMPRISGL